MRGFGMTPVCRQHPQRSLETNSRSKPCGRTPVLFARPCKRSAKVIIHAIRLLSPGPLVDEGLGADITYAIRKAESIRQMSGNFADRREKGERRLAKLTSASSTALT